MVNNSPIRDNKKINGPIILGSPIKLAIHLSCMVPYSVAYVSSLSASLQYSTASACNGVFMKFSKNWWGTLKEIKLNKTGME